MAPCPGPDSSCGRGRNSGAPFSTRCRVFDLPPLWDPSSPIVPGVAHRRAVRTVDHRADGPGAHPADASRFRRDAEPGPETPGLQRLAAGLRASGGEASAGVGAESCAERPPSRACRRKEGRGYERAGRAGAANRRAPKGRLSGTASDPGTEGSRALTCPYSERSRNAVVEKRRRSSQGRSEPAPHARALPPHELHSRHSGRIRRLLPLSGILPPAEAHELGRDDGPRVPALSLPGEQTPSARLAASTEGMDRVPEARARLLRARCQRGPGGG